MFLVVCRFFPSFRSAIYKSNRFDPDWARHLVGPELGPICLLRLWKDEAIVGTELH